MDTEKKKPRKAEEIIRWLYTPLFGWEPGQ
jgi:hypothetical protein